MRTVRIPGMLLTQCTMLWVRLGENIGARALLLCVSHASTALSKHEVGVEPLFCFVFWDCGRACARGWGGGYGRLSWPLRTDCTLSRREGACFLEDAGDNSHSGMLALVAGLLCTGLSSCVTQWHLWSGLGRAEYIPVLSGKTPRHAGRPGICPLLLGYMWRHPEHSPALPERSECSRLFSLSVVLTPSSVFHRIAVYSQGPGRIG